MSSLFDPYTLRDVIFRNRLGISPMCQYSSVEGMPDDWHLVHLGARALGGSGLIITEASAVEPRGRITDCDAGLWNAAQADAWARVVKFCQAHGARVGTQLAHAGRKASTAPPWKDRGAPITRRPSRLAADRAERGARSTKAGTRRFDGDDARRHRHAVVREFVEARAALPVERRIRRRRAARRPRLPAPQLLLAAEQPSRRRLRRLVRRTARSIVREAVEARIRSPRSRIRHAAVRPPELLRLDRGRLDDSTTASRSRSDLKSNSASIVIDCSSGGERAGRQDRGQCPAYQVPFAEQHQTGRSRHRDGGGRHDHRRAAGGRDRAKTARRISW